MDNHSSVILSIPTKVVKGDGPFIAPWLFPVQEVEVAERDRASTNYELF
jgi:hypothetical protein